MKDADLYLNIHRALATLLMKNRFIRRLTHTGLSRGEIHILIELQARGECTVRIIQPLLNIDQSSISRFVKNLTQKKLISATHSEMDKRAKVLRLTAAGRKAIAQIDEVAGVVFEQFASRLSATDKKILAEFFERIADWHGQPRCPLRPGESEVRMQQRRMSRSLGVLSQNIFGSQLSSSQWFVFREICYAAYPLNPKTLSEHQSIAPNSLSIILEKLENAGLITRASAIHDSRYIELLPTAQGKKQLAMTEKRSAEDLEKVMVQFPQERQEQLLSIVRRYIDQDATTSPVLLPQDFTLRKINVKNERNKARAFAITELVRRGHAEFAPPVLIGEKSLVYGLFDGKENLQAICEIQNGGSSAEFSLLASNKETTPNLAYIFMERVFETLRGSGDISTLNFSFDPAIRLLQKAGILGAQATLALS